jgi:hypothetical protein
MDGKITIEGDVTTLGDFCELADAASEILSPDATITVSDGHVIITEAVPAPIGAGSPPAGTPDGTGDGIPAPAVDPGTPVNPSPVGTANGDPAPAPDVPAPAAQVGDLGAAPAQPADAGGSLPGDAPALDAPVSGY